VGSIAVELVILAPLVGLLLAGVVLVGRVQSTRADIEGAARAAARDLSMARDVRAAIPDARGLVDSMLQVGSSSCRRASLRTEITAVDVSVTVVCQVGLRDVAVLPVPGSMTISATATEPVDQHVEHTP
jgi:hypothetical protein